MCSMASVPYGTHHDNKICELFFFFKLSNSYFLLSQGTLSFVVSLSQKPVVSSFFYLLFLVCDRVFF